MIPQSPMSSPEPPPDLPLMQFRLRTLFLVVAGASVLLAILVMVEGPVKLAILLAVFAVGGHVAGARFGMQLRANSERRRRWRESAGVIDLDQSTSRLASRRLMESPTVGPLATQSTRLPWMPLAVAVCAIAGGAVAAGGLSTTIGDGITKPGLMVGVFSTAALSGWIGYVTSGFVGIFRHAWQDALANGDRKPTAKNKDA